MPVNRLGETGKIKIRQFIPPLLSKAFLTVYSAEIFLYTCWSRDLILMWTPLIERSISLGINLGFKVGSSISSYFFNVRAVTTFSSFMAKV